MFVQAGDAGTTLAVSTDAAVSRTATQPASVTGSGFVLLWTGQVQPEPRR